MIDTMLASIITRSRERELSGANRFGNIAKAVEKQVSGVAEKIDELGSKAAQTAQDLRNRIQNGLLAAIQAKHPEVRNLQVHQGTSRMIVANDPNWQFRRGIDVSLGKGLYAASDIGNVRENQEDSVLIMYHPQNPAFKMLVVSDGMGGLANGEMASSFVVEKINQWFNSLSPQAFHRRNTEALRQHFESAIKEINKRLHTQIQNSGGERAGATFCGAIVTEKETIISNVGDSRAYVYSGGKLEQITIDDNMLFLMQKEGLLNIEKDEIRFQQGSNAIFQAMGLETEVEPKSTVIANSSYDCLMLVSDGISDCLSDDQIKAITKRTPRDRLAQMLIQEAKARDSRSKDKDNKRVIRAGKDNASVALYDRNEMKREHER